MQRPHAQLRAGHIPADLYRQIPAGSDPRRVVIVQAAPPSYVGPILLTLAVTGGVIVVLVMIAVTLKIAAAGAVAVLSATGGLSLTLKRAKSHTK